MKKLMLLVASVGFLMAGLFPFALPASAAAAYNWSNAATIIGPGNTSFVWNPAGNTNIFASTKLPSPSCTIDPGVNNAYKPYKGAALIDQTDGLTGPNYTLYTYTAPAPVNGQVIGYCKQTVTGNLAIGNSAAEGIVYVWVNKNTIQAFSSGPSAGSSYNWDDTKTYISTDGTNFTAGDSNCPSRLVATTDHRFGRVTQSGDSIGPTKTVNGCTVQTNGKNFTLGSPQNASLAPVPGGTGGTGPGGTTTPEDICANDPSTGAWAWIICPTITSVTGIMTNLYDNFIKPSLQVDPLGKNPNLQLVWAQFRNMADVLFVLVFLMVIFSTVTSVGVSSYTIKKALPRLVAAAILVQFSWFLCGFAIDIGNILGAGISNVVNYALSGAKITGTNTTDSLNMLMSNIASFGLITIAGAAAVAAVIFAGPTLLFLMLGLLISLITLAVTLVVRLLVLKVLIVLAPIAIVLWVLPNTESLFKKWYQNFTKLILMYPIIALLVAGGQIVQSAGQADQNKGFEQLAAILAPMIAFFLIPATFKMAGTMMGTVSGAIAKRGSAISSAATNSQYAKDKKEAYRGGSAQKYLNSDGKGIGGHLTRARGMLGSGRVIPTAASRRSVARTAANFEKTQGDDIQAQMARANGGTGFTKEEYTALMSGTDTKGVKATETAQKSALAMAAKTANWDAIRDAQKVPGTKLTPGMISQGLAGSDVYTKARDIVQGNAALDMTTGDMFSSSFSSTKKLALERMGKQFTAVHPADAKDAEGNSIAKQPDTAARSAANDTFASVLQAIDKNSGSIDIGTQNTLWSYVRPANADGTGGPDAPAGMSDTQKAAIRERFDANGSLKQRPQDVHAV